MDSNNSCADTLTGIYCKRCRYAGYYYAPTSSGQPSQCKPCDQALHPAAALAVFVGILLGIWAATQQLIRAFRSTGAYQSFVWLYRKVINSKLADIIRGLRLGNKIKITIGFYMIATEVGSVYEVELPEDVQQLLDQMTIVLTFGIKLGIRVSPLACAGLGGYIAELLFWMVTPLAVVTLVMLASLVKVAASQRQKSKGAPGALIGSCGSTALLRAMPYVLRILFLMYPIVTQQAFKAFPCYTFDEGLASSTSWLRADVSIQRGTERHMLAQLIAGMALLLYPVGLLLLFGGLLWLARHTEDKEIRKAIAFLYLEYQPSCFFWELAEMLRRLLLVGVFVLIKPGSIEQLASASLVALAFLSIQLTAAPFRRPDDNFLASACSLALAVLFLLSILYKYAALTQLDKVQGVMSAELQHDYSPSFVMLSGIMWCACISALAVLALIVISQAAAAARRQMTTRRLQERDRDNPVTLPPCPSARPSVCLSVQKCMPVAGAWQR